MSQANYGGKQPNNTAYIKTFNVGDLGELWKPASYMVNKTKLNILTPVIQKDIYIPRNIYLGGEIIHTPTLSNSTIITENISPFYLESTPNYISTFQRLELEIQELKKEIAELKTKMDI